MLKQDILLVGTFPKLKNEKKLGGAMVIVENTEKYFKEINLSFSSINLYKYTTIKPIIFLINAVLILFAAAKHNKILLNVTQKTFLYFSPVIYLICRFYKKKFILRLIGGSINESFKKQLGWYQSFLTKTSLNADMILAETRENQHFFAHFNENVKWIPNCRRLQKGTNKRKRPFKRRFVFISQVKKSKGIDTLIEASKYLSKQITIDIYGPILEKGLTESLLNTQQLNYCGALNIDEVIPTLSQYDVLILPTYYEGEGYPGIIIEALSLGIPVITTNWKAIPDVIQDNFNGYLLPIKNAKYLAKAINNLTAKEYERLSQNAAKSFDKFDLDIVYAKLSRLVHNL